MTFSDESRLAIPVSDDDHIQGPENTPLTLVEYGDYECQYCAAAYPVVQALQWEFGDSLRFVYRNFPIIASHRNAQRAAEAVEAAADQDAFWPMHERLFERKSELSPELIDQIASEIGLDMERFRSDIDSRRFEQRVREQFMGGVRSGVGGTPTFYVNDRRYDGPVNFEAMKLALDSVLDAGE